MTYNLFFEFPNNSHLPSRLERFSEQELKFSPRFVLNERVAGEKKKFFFEKLWPNTLSHKNSGGRICVRSREKCWQSTETLKKTSPFVYPSQRKHAKLKHYVKNVNLENVILRWESECVQFFVVFLTKKKSYFLCPTGKSEKKYEIGKKCPFINFPIRLGGGVTMRHLVSK